MTEAKSINAETWPMPNEELQQWFSRENIPIEELTQMWLSMDQNPRTKSEITDLHARNDTEVLEKRLRQRIQFGTAGLRGRMEAGFSSMNNLTVIQASQGLADYVFRNITDAKSKGVVLGRDHRHNSDTFMRLTAAAFLARGFKIFWFKDLLNHTPLVPYGVDKLGAACGVMITASHNPAMDNGYKVYWENGCQILSPHDTGIQNSIMANLAPYSWDTDAIETDPSAVDVTDRLFPAYIEDVVHLAFGKSIPEIKPPKFVYTPMHGVGMRIFDRVMYSLGFEGQIYPVHAQAFPDPDFPTVKFPNPEEKGALDMAIALAVEEEAPLVLANDPDADRFCAAERRADGQWHIFTGNEMGIILAHHVFTHYASQPNFNTTRLAMLSSAVSSKMLRSMAHKEKFHHEETLTGFKWMGNKSLDLVRQGYVAPYAFEEAIGYMFGDIVRDKDGIAAATVFLSLVVEVYERRGTICQLLETLYRKYGYFASQNSYVICEPTQISFAFHRLRHLVPGREGITYIEYFGDHKISKIKDVSLGYDSATAQVPVDKHVEPSAEMITFELENGTVMTLRGSGTEPKLKYYIEAKGTSMEAAQETAKQVENAVTKVLNEVLPGL